MFATCNTAPAAELRALHRRLLLAQMLAFARFGIRFKWDFNGLAFAGDSGPRNRRAPLLLVEQEQTSQLALRNGRL